MATETLPTLFFQRVPWSPKGQVKLTSSILDQLRITQTQEKENERNKRVQKLAVESRVAHLEFPGWGMERMVRALVLWRTLGMALAGYVPLSSKRNANCKLETFVNFTTGCGLSSMHALFVLRRVVLISLVLSQLWQTLALCILK